MAQRALSHSWVSPIPEIIASDIFTQGGNSTYFSSETLSCTTGTGSIIQLCSNNDLQQHGSTASFSAPDIPTYIKPMNPTVCSKSSPFLIPDGDLPSGFMFSPLEMPGPTTKNTVDVASMILNLGDASKTSESIDFGGPPQQQFNGFFVSSPQDMQRSIGGTGDDEMGLRENPSASGAIAQWGNIRSIGFPFSLPSNLPDPWKPSLPWDSPPYPSEMSTTYSTN